MEKNLGPLVNNFEVPTWGGKPPPGLHLDVVKENKMVQKLVSSVNVLRNVFR